MLWRRCGKYPVGNLEINDQSRCVEQRGYEWRGYEGGV